MENFTILKPNNIVLFKSYQIEILNILDDKNLNSFKKEFKVLTLFITDKTLVFLRNEIKKKINRPDKIEDILISYFKRYNTYLYTLHLSKKRNLNRKKEDSVLVNLRVQKFRANTKKVSLQVLLKPDFKAKFDKRKNDLNLTTEQFIIKLFYNSF